MDLLRPIDDFRLPDVYADNLRHIYGELIDEYGTELDLLVVAGSCGYEAPINGWSDIDLILGFRVLTFECEHFLAHVFANRTVQVGASIYGRRDLELGFVNNKTHRCFYYIQNGHLRPTVWSPDLKVPWLTRESCCTRDNLKLLDIASQIRDLLLQNRPEDIKKLFKVVALAMKLMLFAVGENPHVYSETFNLFSDRYNVEKLEPERYQYFLGDYAELRSYASKVAALTTQAISLGEESRGM